MVSMSRRSMLRRHPAGAHHHHHHRVDKSALGVVGVGVILLVVWMSTDSNNINSLLLQNSRNQRRKETLQHPHLRVVPAKSLHQERFNAVALDILRTLECEALFQQDEQQQANDETTTKDAASITTATSRRRNLQQGRGGSKNKRAYNNKLTQDDFDEDDEDASSLDIDEEDVEQELPTARHLFCLAAFAPLLDRQQGADPDPGALHWKERTQCDISNTQKQKALLDLWSSARSTFSTKQFLLQVLDMATEQERDLVQHKLHLWLPRNSDGGTDYSIETINNSKQDADHGGIHGLEQNLGWGKTFVDVGSAFGITSMAVSLLYPGTRIVSVEAAPPNWFVQELNWICAMNYNGSGGDDEDEDDTEHHHHQQEKDKFEEDDEGDNSDNNKPLSTPTPIRILAGVGPAVGGPQFAPMMWRRDAPTNTRSWSAAHEIHPDQDVEINVQLKSWKSILAEAGLESSTMPIDVMNVDCEGCEYNLIPDLSQDAFEAILTVLGDVHWGYIPLSKKPSSQRADITHRRLCTHENMARTAKECCAFLDLPVKSSVPGQVLFREAPDETSSRYAEKATVHDVAGDFCEGFDEWAAERHLFTVTSDWGWFQLTSTAEDE